MFWDSILNVLYPPLCTGCGNALEKGYTTFCATCFSSLQLLDVQGRCSRCFRPLEEGSRCMRCSVHGLRSIAACFDESPISRRAVLCGGLGITGFMALQLDALRWPPFDIIVPTPGDWFSNKNDQWSSRRFFAKSLSSIVGCRYDDTVRMNRENFSVAYLPLENQPGEAPVGAITVRTPENFVNSRVLLVHDKFLTGHSFTATAHALLTHGALGVWGISLLAASTSHMSEG